MEGQPVRVEEHDTQGAVGCYRRVYVTRPFHSERGDQLLDQLLDQLIDQVLDHVLDQFLDQALDQLFD